jgi:hypothetical protein
MRRRIARLRRQTALALSAQQTNSGTGFSNYPPAECQCNLTIYGALTDI